MASEEQVKPHSDGPPAPTAGSAEDVHLELLFLAGSVLWVIGSKGGVSSATSSAKYLGLLRGDRE
jgi:hypothetical protein